MEGKTGVKEKRLAVVVVGGGGVALKPGIPTHFLTGRHSLMGFFLFFLLTDTCLKSARSSFTLKPLRDNAAF